MKIYDVISIFKMAAVSHVVFALGQWRTTHKVPFVVWIEVKCGVLLLSRVNMFRTVLYAILCGLDHWITAGSKLLRWSIFKHLTSAITPDNATRISASSSLTFASEHFKLSIWFQQWQQTQPAWLMIVVNTVNTSSERPVHAWWYTCLHASHLILSVVTVIVSLQYTQSSSSSDCLLLLSVTCHILTGICTFACSSSFLGNCLRLSGCW